MNYLRYRGARATDQGQAQFARRLSVRRLGLTAMMLLGGCAAVPPTPTMVKATATVTDGVSQLEAVRLNVGNLLDVVRPSGAEFDADNDPLFQILVAEFAGQRGHLDIAAQHYVAAAMQLQDVEVAKRATRIAVFSRDNPAALAAAKIWVEQAPKDLEARQILAAMYIRDGDADAATVQLESVLNAETEGPNRQLGIIANLLRKEEDKLTALNVMERLMSRRESDADVLVAYALLAIRTEEVERATTAMERLTEFNAGNSNIALAYVSLLQKFDKSASAFNWLEKAIAKQSDDTGLRLIYARLLADSNRYDEARLQFSIIATQTPSNSDVVYSLGLLNLQANRIDAASENFSRLLELGVHGNDANFYLAQIADSREQVNSALELYRKITSGANYFQAQVRIALLLSLQNNVVDAQAQLQSVVPKDDAQRFQIARAEGEILTQHDRFDEAMAVYDAALVDAYDMELLYTRAMLAEKMDLLDVLEADLHTIIEREPDNSQALNALGYTLADHTDRYQEAYEFVQRALVLSPEDFYILDSMGWVLYRLGRLSDSVDYLTRARKIKDDPEVAAHLGEVLWVMGDKEAARDIWDSALKEKPDDQRLLDVIERLAP